MSTTRTWYLPRARSRSWTALFRLTRRGLPEVIRYLFLASIGLLMATPFLWMLSTALKAEHEVFMFPPVWIAQPLQWRNFALVFEQAPFLLWTKNTLIITVVATVGTLLTTSMVAYGFARLRFWGRDFWFVVLVSTMMLPAIVTMIPRFILFSKLGWIDTFLPLTIPFWFGGTPFYVFLLRQFLTTLPIELEEAAYVDGAGPFTVFASIIMPLCKPALGTIAIFSFLFHWNEFMSPMLYLNDPAMKTLSVGLRYFQSQMGTQWAMLMGAATLMIIPVVLLFFFAQRYFVQGIALSGLSGR